MRKRVVVWLLLLPALTLAEVVTATVVVTPKLVPSTQPLYAALVVALSGGDVAAATNTTLVLTEDMKPVTARLPLTVSYVPVTKTFRVGVVVYAVGTLTYNNTTSEFSWPLDYFVLATVGTDNNLVLSTSARLVDVEASLSFLSGGGIPAIALLALGTLSALRRTRRQGN